MGFEPMKPFWSLRTFQARAFDHSAISPLIFYRYSMNIFRFSALMYKKNQFTT